MVGDLQDAFFKKSLLQHVIEKITQILYFSSQFFNAKRTL